MVKNALCEASLGVRRHVAALDQGDMSPRSGKRGHVHALQNTNQHIDSRIASRVKKEEIISLNDRVFLVRASGFSHQRILACELGLR
jgi:hypothetical protein